MPASKQVRANAIISRILEKDKELGGIDPRTKIFSRMVADADGLDARIVLDHRIDVAPTYGASTERRLIRDKGWRAVSVRYRGSEMLVVNIRGSALHIAYYKPGRWEALFDVDWEGDHQLHAWGDGPIGDDIDEQLRLREKDLQLEPARGHPPEVDELRTSVMRPRRGPQPQVKPDSPLTVTLQR